MTNRLVLPAVAKSDARPSDAKPNKPGKPAGFDHAKCIGEFSLVDGRKISIHRHSVTWCTPLKSDPERATLVGVKGGEHPVPVTIAYTDFVAWWKA